MGTENGKPATAREHLDRIEAKLDKLLAHLGADRQGGNGQSAQSGQVAPVSQIKGEHGDPEIGKMPRNWNGPSYEGYTASQCSVDFLDFYADFLDWKADNPREGKEKYAKYDRLNAARCRRWALEIREGRHKQGEPQRQAAPPPPPPPGDDYERGSTQWSGAGGMPPPPGDYDMPPPPGDDDSDVPF